jgi:hypothetical protein
MIGNNASLSNAMAAAARTRSCSQWHASRHSSRAVGRNDVRASRFRRGNGSHQTALNDRFESAIPAIHQEGRMARRTKATSLLAAAGICSFASILGLAARFPIRSRLIPPIGRYRRGHSLP